jgi:hypothetical protein
MGNRADSTWKAEVVLGKNGWSNQDLNKARAGGVETDTLPLNAYCCRCA